MKEAIELSIVMPVYNEAAVLPWVLEEVATAVSHVNYTYEVLLLNDASTDGSAEILDQFAKTNSKFRIIHLPKNQGIMGALEILNQNAKGKYLFFNSSDGQFHTRDCIRMMELREKHDLIVGKRKHKCYNIQRHLVSWGFNFLAKLFFGVNTYDAGSIKLYHRSILSLPLISKSPFREAERIIRAKRAGFRIGKIEVEHHYRKGGVATGARFSLVLHSLFDLVRCILFVNFRNKSCEPPAAVKYLS